MSGYRVNDTLNSSAREEPGETLLLRALPLNSPFFTVYPFSASPPYGGSIHFRDLYFPIIDALIVSAADGAATSVHANMTPVAQECTISWCVKTIKSSYAMGQYEEIVTKTFLNTTARQLPYPWEAFPEVEEDAVFTIFHGNISVHPPSSNFTKSNFGVSNETFARTAALFEELLPSSITAANATAPLWWRVKISAWAYNQLRPVTKNNPWLAPNNVSQYLEKFTTAMTNVIRSHSSHEFVEGRAYKQTTFITVHWEWLTFPLMLLLLSLIFLVATMIKTSKYHAAGLGMWKTSAMPTLIYGLPPGVQAGVSDPSTWGRVSGGGGKQVKIRLLPKQGWRVSGLPSTSPTLRSRANHRVPPGWI